MVCPGSVVLSEGMPEKSSAFAEEGTRAHSLAESVLSGEKQEATDQGMYDNVRVYTDHVRSLGGKLHIEQRVSVNEQVYGTADAVVWQPGDKHLHIIDLKYGAGVPVEVDSNLQLKIYALATLLTFGYPATQVTATIVQPRCPHPGGPVRSVTYDVVDLLDFHADLEDAVDNVSDASSYSGKVSVRWQDDYLQPSEKGCRWCLAAPKCPALKSKAQALAKQVFAPGLPYDPKALAETLDFLPILEGWIKNTREFAYDEAEKGHNIPDWKLVEKRATRKWKLGAVVTDTLLSKAGLTIEQVMREPELNTPAAIEKLLPKEQRALLDELCVKESSGHTLVHASDKREAIKVDAKSAFANS